MEKLNHFGAEALIDQRLSAGRHVLGICVGMQVMFESGSEHGVETAGLGQWPGRVEMLTAPTLPNIDDTFLANQDETEELLKDISLAEQTGLLGLFKITITNGSTDYDILTADKEIKNDFVTFLVHILNLKRFWKYKKINTNEVFVTNNKQPLVKYGYIELEGSDFNPVQIPPDLSPNPPYCYPNADVISIEKDGADIYSVIFI
jgi:hypothetical protein